MGRTDSTKVLSCVRLGNAYNDEKFTGGEYGGNVWDVNGLSPTMKTGASASQQCTVEIKKMEEIKNDKQVKIKIRQATKDGFIECEVPGLADLNYVSSTTRRGRVNKGGKISPTITTENIPNVIEFGNPDFYNFIYEVDGELYLIRIRKLTPKECLRLMDVGDETISRMEETENNTNLYKAAGNSIVTNCLVAIFGQLFDGKEDVYKHDTTRSIKHD